ncbi:uncharacterized protein HMPREF1541_03924 [Cyphellophora europaea CBS 101466]|uniref:rRNA-processing protein EBP2 n=1 Tax=Cyphellophora europaea (strain CBS 101466) TaxID=1220924 RepID=W2S068_CYPE1|nr:uncharacterized protein HMPREF1541_03924 [Cyphellophora europaea CBS 101466]ETN41985.1 hypothetical protein HMPREF1541_03924 [Cyphellophora europaea CBS 101466]
MVKKSKLLAALDAHKGRDYEAEKRKKALKAGEKAKKEKVERKLQQMQEEQDAAIDSVPALNADKAAIRDNSSGEEGDVDGVHLDAEDAAEHLSDSANEEDEDEDDDEDDDDEDDEDEDVALSDLSDEDKEDTVPHQRLTINNGPALLASQSRIALLRKHPRKEKAPFHIHNSLISSMPAVSASVTDPNDDLLREQEFYKVARAAALEARSLLKKEDVPFTRPSDYFAEMVKSEGHMERIHKKQYDDAAQRKGREEARRQRDAKKFGKQVQVAKEQERAKLKRETLDKIKDLKRKRKGNPSEATREGDGDMFDVDVEAAPKQSRTGRDRDGSGSNAKRQKKDSKFGFGGKKRFSKSGDAESSADMRGFSSAKMKGKGGGAKKRPGKSRRAAGR